MIEISQIKKAYHRIRKYVHHTPLLTNKDIDNYVGAKIFFKCENFQPTGSFKIRGVTNVIQQLKNRELQNGLATVSSGNHGAALSLTAKRKLTTATVVMPSNTPKIKIENVKRYGGNIFWCEPNQSSREKVLKDIVTSEKSTIIHPYNDERIIAGQATVALEMIKDQPDLDCIISPVSGGGLLSGTLSYAKKVKPHIEIFGAEPIEANDTFISLERGKIIPNKTTNTICDGLRAQVGTITYPIIAKFVEEIITVSDCEVIFAMRMIWDRLKVIIEPSCSITLAALIKSKSKFRNKKVGLILSGGNVDLDHLPWK